ncbi:MAG: ParB/RepB/Spo0J family partition protein [Pseudomonadota bacterium]
MAAARKKEAKGGARGLGRGLDALLGDVPTGDAGSAETTRADVANATPEGSAPMTLPVAFLHPNADQPRRIFNDDAIQELAASIKARGLLQPILVRPRGKDEFEIVAGERRWRAAQKAELHEVPVLIRDLTDEESAEIALIENVQRVDLNPMEEAEAYKRLGDVYKRTQEQIAKAVGKSRSHVANIMRLLTLPNATRSAVREGRLSMGHARALIGSSDPDFYCELVIREALSVRQTEDLVKRNAGGESPGNTLATDEKSTKSATSSGKKDADTRALEADLAAALGLEVQVDHSKGGSGSVTISYLTLDQLDDLCGRLMGAGV